MKLAILVFAALSLSAADLPCVSFTKSFPGSTPAYVGISVSKTGAAEYKEDAADDNPLKFQLSAADTNEVFALADKLDHFTHPVESGLKVANMGAKTFRYEAADGVHEAKFNYSEDPDARTLLDWFEKIAESERALINLERTVRFDKLGVQDAILQLEMLRDQKRLVADEQFLPLLDRIVKGESYLHMARTRAAALTESIRISK